MIMVYGCRDRGGEKKQGEEKLLCLQGIQKDGLEEKAQLGELYTDAMKNRE